MLDRRLSYSIEILRINETGEVVASKAALTHLDYRGALTLEPGQEYSLDKGDPLFSFKNGTAAGLHVVVAQLDGDVNSHAAFESDGNGSTTQTNTTESTTSVVNPPDSPSGSGSAGYGAFREDWWLRGNLDNWEYNPSGEPGDLTGAENAISGGVQRWDDQAGSMYDSWYGGTNSLRDQTDTSDGVPAVGWGTLNDDDTQGDDALAESTAVDNDDNNFFEDALMTLDSDNEWSTADGGLLGNMDLETIVVHEAGHWLKLWDLYNPNDDNYAAWMGENNEDMVMYGKHAPGEIRRNLQWGDLSGLRYLYPVRSTMVTEIGDDTKGAGLDQHAFGDTDAPDLYYAYIDDPEGENTIYHGTCSNVATGGTPESCGPAREAFGGIGWYNEGLGTAHHDIDSTGNADFLFVWIDDPSGANTIHYRVGYDMSEELDIATGEKVASAVDYSPIYDMPGEIGYHSSGLGACLQHIDSDSDPELILAWADNPSGADKILYRIGFDVGANGKVQGQWSSIRQLGEDIGDQTAGVGLGCPDLDRNGDPDLVAPWMDDPSGGNTMYYKVGLNPDETGSVDNTYSRRAPGRPGSWGADTWGAGLGYGDIDGEPAGGIVPEMFFGFVDDPDGGNAISYQTEWNGRYNSHP